MLRAAAAERNKAPIAEVLKAYLFNDCKFLELASGTGQHISHFASLFPNVTFQPSEVDHRSLHSIVAYVDNFRFANLRVPLFLDATKSVSCWALPEDFSPHQVDIIYNANMIHISSNNAVQGLFQAAGGLLKYGTGALITYGPYAVNGVITPQSNILFDSQLRSENPEWGLRDVTFLQELGNKNGLLLEKTFDMPANNKILVFRRKSNND